MLQIEFTEEEKQALNFERYYYPHPHVQRKMETVWLKSQGLPHQEICRLADISPHTLCDYLRDYNVCTPSIIPTLLLSKPPSWSVSAKRTHSINKR